MLNLELEVRQRAHEWNLIRARPLTNWANLLYRHCERDRQRQEKKGRKHIVRLQRVVREIRLTCSGLCLEHAQKGGLSPRYSLGQKWCSVCEMAFNKAENMKFCPCCNNQLRGKPHNPVPITLKTVKRAILDIRYGHCRVCQRMFVLPVLTIGNGRLQSDRCAFHKRGEALKWALYDGAAQIVTKSFAASTFKTTNPRISHKYWTLLRGSTALSAWQ